MRDDQKKFIENNIQLIEENNWVEFFDKCNNKSEGVGMGGILYEAKIDWLPYMYSIPTYSFSGSKVSSITIPSNIKNIGICAFEGSKNIEYININQGVTRIEEAAFRSCSNLKTINIPHGIRSIKYELFYGCSKLEKIELPQSLTVIQENAFTYCSSITHLNIPDKVKKIEYGAFRGCTNLKSIDLNNATQLGGSLFYHCSRLEEIKLPQGTQNIGWEMFANCNSLKYMIIPNSVLSIDSSAFKNVTQTITITYDGTKNDWLSLIQDVKDLRYVCNCTDGVVEN